MNPGLPNLARRDAPPDELRAVDERVVLELEAAGIEAKGFEVFRGRGEVPTKFIGQLCGWGFTRAWRYWVADGPGVPPARAEEFHRTWGREVRVDGHCGCPSPLEWFHGFAVGTYHVDTLEGLVAFAALLRSIDTRIKT